MTEYTIKYFVSESGRNLIEEWIEEQNESKKVKAKFIDTMQALRDQPMHFWVRPYGFDKLKGEYRDLGKFMFKYNKVQYRPLGFFGPATREFTLLAGATERDGKFHPPNVRDTAIQRMKSVLQNHLRAHEWDF